MKQKEITIPVILSHNNGTDFKVTSVSFIGLVDYTGREYYTSKTDYTFPSDVFIKDFDHWKIEVVDSLYEHGIDEWY